MNYIFYIIFIIFHINRCTSKNYKNYTLFRAIPVSEENLIFLLNLSTVYGANFWRYPSLIHKPAEFVIPPEKKKQFLKHVDLQEMYTTTIIEDVQSAFDKQKVKSYVRRNMESFDWSSYFRLDDIYEWLKDLSKNYKGVMELQSIGKTYEKRDILAVTINKGKNTGTYKPKVIVEGGIHAREWVSISFVTYFIHELLTTTNNDLINIAEFYEFFFVPVLNPDGYEHSHTKDRMHRKNLRGVDINRNFGIHFGTVGISNSSDSDVYCGPYAFSEAESLAMEIFVKENSINLKYYLGFHSYGQYIILPYAYSKKHLDNYEKVYNVGKQTARSISQKYGTEYTIGTAYDTVGYLTSGVSGCWVKKTFKVPYVLTFELPDNGKHGFALPPEDILPICRETMDGMIELLNVNSNEKRLKVNAAPIFDNFIKFWNIGLFIIVRYDW